MRSLITVLQHPFDVIGITETRLHELNPLVNIDIPGYVFKHTPTTTMCGGAGIYIKSCYQFDILQHISDSHADISESFFIELKREGFKNLIIGCIYRHHTPIEKFMNTFFKNALTEVSKSANKLCALMGDFNIDLIKYASESCTGKFYDLLCSHSFRPLILQPTRVTLNSATLIDNIFINEISCHSLGGNVTSSISDHFFQFSQIDIFQTTDYKKKVKYSRNFRNFNKREFSEEIINIDWSSIINEVNGTDVSYHGFYKKLEEILDLMAPYQKLSQKNIKLEERPWITKGLLISMKKRDKLAKCRTQEKDILHKNEISVRYKLYRNMIVTLIKKSKKNYYTSFFLINQGNVKKTWDGIRNLINVSKKKNTSPSKIIYKNETYTSNFDMAESLNDFFIHVGSSIETKIPNSNKTFSYYLENANNKSIFLRPCDNMEVLLIVNGMNSSKSCGPNSIPTNLLIEFSHELINPLVSIINMSLKEGVFPNLNKVAVVCPIHKKDAMDKCANYRPISLLSNLSKIFERIMYARLEDFLKDSEILYEYQFGFRKQHSTNHALLSIIEKIRYSLDNNMYACGIFIDLEKAFDTVNHQILLYKLNHYGIRGVANSWFSSYLSNRSQSVTLNGVTSTEKDISCGVPQGSILGPLLFLIYINDMHCAAESSTLYHFADDTNLLCSNKSLKKLKIALNKDLAILYDWLCANRLSINAGKTEFIVFRPSRKRIDLRITLKLHHTRLYESSKIKYLGLILDNKLNWKAHITELSKKLGRAVGLLNKVKTLCPPPVLKSLYYSLFNSHVAYGLVVWGNSNKTDMDKIKSLQKRAIYAIAEKTDDFTLNRLLSKLRILSVDDLYKLQLSSLMWDYDHGIIPSSFQDMFQRSNIVHQHNTRGASRGNLYYPKVNTIKYGINSFTYQGIQTLNNLKQLSIYQDTIIKSKFLKKLKLLLISEYI